MGPKRPQEIGKKKPSFYIQQSLNLENAAALRQLLSLHPNHFHRAPVTISKY
jgi:hypothetical protein